MPPTSADIVIIGAGVIGCSSAYHLARLGISEVVLVEMGTAGSGVTSQSASMLSLQFPEDPLLARMALHSYQRHLAFEQEMGVPIDFHRIGWIYLATAENAAWLRDHARMLVELGIETEILSPAELKGRFPNLQVEDLEIATWGPEDGPVNPHMIVSGYLQRARDQGVKILEGVRATDIQIRKGKVAAVQTTHGPISTRTLINAAGPWAAEVGAWAGIDIPLENAARTVVVTDATPTIPRDHPFVDDLSTEWYFRPEGDGVLMAKGKTKVAAPMVRLDPEMVAANIEAAIHRVPSLKTARVRTAWTGVRPLTQDGLPILGPVQSVEGLILNCGWGGMGIIQSPIAGEWIAEYLAGDRTTAIELSTFLIDRFKTI